jgi:putative PIN family toxin of toxin-antitoxin system
MSRRRPLATESQKKLRAVLDTNVPIAAHLSRNPDSPTVELLRRWKDKEFVQLYSDGTLDELNRKFAEKKIDPQIAAEYIAHLIESGIYVEIDPGDIEPVIPADPDDDLIVACAVVGGATHIVTYDPHFKVLGEEHKGIEVVDGLTFLQRVRGGESPERS